MNNSSGKIGERYVVQMLLEQGYMFIDAKYHSRFGEIDIIVADDKYIVFVEVKTRDTNSRSKPLEAVTSGKKKKLIQTALLYLQEHEELQHLQPRFDAAGIITTGKNKEITEVQYITNAFDGGGLF